MSGASMIRSGFRLYVKKIQPILNKTNSRNASHGPVHSGVYRMDAPPVLYGPQVRIMKVVQIIVWWHMFYSFWYNPELMLGHPSYQMPNPSLWTDEELGIPPDDYDEVV